MEYEQINGKEKFSILNKQQHNVLFSFEAVDNTPQRTLREAVKQEVSLVGADFNGSVFRELNDFSGADLRKADFRSSELPRVNFKSADLREADLRNADFGGADFEGADLRGANVLLANFKGANFKNANLEGIDFALTGQKNKWHITREGADVPTWEFRDMPDMELTTQESINLAGKLFRTFEATNIFIPQEARFRLFFYKKPYAKPSRVSNQEIELSKDVLTSDYVVKELEICNAKRAEMYDVMLITYASISGKTFVYIYDDKDAVVRRQIPGILYFNLLEQRMGDDGKEMLAYSLFIKSNSSIWVPFPRLENIELSRLNNPLLTKLIKSLTEAFKPKTISPEKPEKPAVGPELWNHDFRINRYKYGYDIDFGYLEKHKDEITKLLSD